jgi:hypothetical protein
VISRCRGLGAVPCSSEGQALTLAAVRGPAAQDDGWNGKWGVEDQGRRYQLCSLLRERRHIVGGRPSCRTVQLSTALTSAGEGGDPPAGPYLKKHIGSRMAAARGLTAAALLAKQFDQELKVKRDREQEAALKAANDPAAWAAEVRMRSMAKVVKQEERARSMTAAFVETERAQATVGELIAKIRRLGLYKDKEALSEGTLIKVRELLSKAGMQPMPGRDPAERKAALRYQLLEIMTAVKALDQCRIEWSKNLCQDESNSGWPRGGMLYSVIADEWPELTHGRIVTNMTHELGVRNLPFVLEPNTGARVMIVLQEVISPGRVATSEQQFGEGTGAEDLLDSLETPLCLRCFSMALRWSKQSLANPLWRCTKK